MAHTVMLVLKVVDPDKCQSALNSLLSGLLAVLLNLKVTFARAVTLGATLGDIIKNFFDKKALPQVLAVVPPEYHKWIPIIVDYVCKAIAICIAMMLQTMISAFHSAVRGGQMFGQGAVRYLHRIGKIEFSVEDSMVDEVAGYVMATIGLLWQFSSGFSLHFPFSLILLPVTMSETFLTYAISWV